MRTTFTIRTGLFVSRKRVAANKQVRSARAGVGLAGPVVTGVTSRRSRNDALIVSTPSLACIPHPARACRRAGRPATSRVTPEGRRVFTNRPLPLRAPHPAPRRVPQIATYLHILVHALVFLDIERSRSKVALMA